MDASDNGDIASTSYYHDFLETEKLKWILHEACRLISACSRSGAHFFQSITDTDCQQHQQEGCAAKNQDHRQTGNYAEYGERSFYRDSYDH